MSDQSGTSFNPLSFLGPRYWLLWLGLGLLRLSCFLPYRGLLLLGSVTGDLMYWLLPRRRHIAATNLLLCFPELSLSERQALLRQNFRSTGISLFEIAWCWWGPQQKLEPLCHIQGLEHLHAAQAQGKGVLLFSAHFTCLEIGGRLLALHVPFYVMYKPHRNPLFEAVMRGSRERQFERAIDRNDIRDLIRTLKQGHTCWYALDQDFGTINAVFAPFFNIPAATLTATTRIARMTGCAIVPFFVHRLDDGSGYQLTIQPPLEHFPSGDDLTDTTRTNALIEKEVRKAPAQYLWTHRRFKNRPAGEVNAYQR
ncbi:MAG: LpxL/LpxP family Kdo(2)-lipid IV(A) lauroyl/palmitoleoyl acyltransferase [Gammaproteobacteria bacterium]|nr:LpxL/LpxP family Kdo(2)-lipid IV(A) lauroyl/palmitoleoyl acyltransferase [Gammaproteobacteria bacterium]